MNKQIKCFIRDYAVSFFVDLLPKFNWVAIQTYPDWEDNGIAIYNELIRTVQIKKIVWLTHNKHTNLAPPPFVVTKETFFVKRKSIYGFLCYSMCRYVFFTHGTYFNRYPKRQISVNMWHGFGFKAVGLLNNSDGIKTSYALGLSSFVNSLISKEMGIPQSSVLNYGFPRNDRLLEAYRNRFVWLDRLGIKNKRILFWMPTYRQSVEGDIRTDGKVYYNPFNLDSFNIDEFKLFCANNNLICFLKLHPMSCKSLEIETESDSVCLINDKWLNDKGITLYQLLGITDLLISDLSSVITDYLLLDKSIIHAFSDFDEYLASRNLLLNPAKDYLVGSLVDNQVDLQKEIKKWVDNNESSLLVSKRRAITNLFFAEKSGNSSAEIIKHIFPNKLVVD